MAPPATTPAGFSSVRLSSCRPSRGPGPSVVKQPEGRGPNTHTHCDHRTAPSADRITQARSLSRASCWATILELPATTCRLRSIRGIISSSRTKSRTSPCWRRFSHGSEASTLSAISVDTLRSLRVSKCVATIRHLITEGVFRRLTATPIAPELPLRHRDR